MGRMRGHLAGGRAPLKFRVSTNLLDLLGVNMYSSVQKAISELVVNGYDADATYVVVESTPRQIVVEDNGDAMDEDAIRDQYMFLGSRHKRRQALTPRLRRAPIGAKGIGKLAGLGIARRIEIETWRDGQAFLYAIDRDEMEKAERSGATGEAMLDRALIPLSVSRTDRPGSGTRVTLRKLRPEITYDAKKLRQHLAQELPLSNTFQVVVDTIKVKRSDTPGKRIAIRHTDPVCGRIEGHIVIAKKRIPQPGIITTVRGRAVGGPSFYDLEVSARRYHSTDFLTGQVECAGLDPDSGASAIKTDREGFTTNHPRYVAFATYMTEQLFRVAKQIEDDNDRRHDEERREKLSEAVRTTAETLNAWNQHHQRRMQLAMASRVPGRRDELHGQEVAHQVVEAEAQGGTRPKGPEHDPREPRDAETLSIALGSGRLRFKNQTFEVRVEPIGEAAPECEIRRDQGLVIVNELHPSYEEAIRGRWTEVVVLRAVTTRFACDESGSATEAYELIDDILRFSANRAKRRRSGTIEEETANGLAPAV